MKNLTKIDCHSKKPKKKKRLFLQVTQDELSLPVAVADSAEKLAKICGVLSTSIYATIRRQDKEGKKYKKYIIVEIDEEEGETDNERENE